MMNCDRVFKDASFHYDWVDYYELRDLDPEVRIPGFLWRGESYNFGPLSGQASLESRVAEIMIGSILKRAGYSSKISETTLPNTMVGCNSSSTLTTTSPIKINSVRSR